MGQRVIGDPCITDPDLLTHRLFCMMAVCANYAVCCLANSQMRLKDYWTVRATGLIHNPGKWNKLEV